MQKIKYALLKIHLFKWDPLHVAQDHPGESSTKVVNHSQVRFFRKQVGEERQHHGVVTDNQGSRIRQGGQETHICTLDV